MNDPRATIILIEDEPTIRRFVRMSLEAEACQVFEADSMRRGLIESGTRKPDLVVLDLGLPDGDGTEFIRDLRTWSDIPVIVLSARASDADKVEALDAGADDYLTKPFSAAELLARVRAQLRRRARASGSSQSTLEFGGIKLDLSRRSATRDGESLHLTPIEYRLLAYLASNADTVLTHKQVLKSVWGPNHVEDSHYVRVYMAHLRKKVERDPSRPQHILTEAGVGYRFVG